MPSSVMLGSRPRISFTRAYSSAVRPCSATISGVTRISVGAVAIFQINQKDSSCRDTIIRALTKTKIARTSGGAPGSSRCLCGTDERFDHRSENYQAIGGAHGILHSALGMRHEAGDVAFAVADARDVGHRAVGIPGRVGFFLCGR